MALEMHVPRSQAEWLPARRLVEAYVAALGVDLGFQGIGHELDHLAQEYGPPRGHFLVATREGAAVGCAGLRPFGADAGEMKRLYVVDSERGRGTGRALAQAIVDAARDIGYRRILLDTLPTMHAAQRLYAELGFRPVAAYRHNPIQGTAYLELAL